MSDQIIKKIYLEAAIKTVWNAIIDHQQFGIWFGVDIKEPFVMGKLSTGEMTIDACKNMQWKSLTLHIEEQRLFSFVWPLQLNAGEVYTDLDMLHRPTTRVEFKLTTINGGTEVLITESGFSQLTEKQRINPMRTNTEGWDYQAENLIEYMSRCK